MEAQIKGVEAREMIFWRMSILHLQLCASHCIGVSRPRQSHLARARVYHIPHITHTHEQLNLINVVPRTRFFTEKPVKSPSLCQQYSHGYQGWINLQGRYSYCTG